MSNPRKVALVSGGGTATVHRFMLGALAYAGEHRGIVTFDFSLREEWLENTAACQVELERLNAWRPDGLVCALEPVCLERLVRELPGGAPVVNLFVSEPIPGVTFVTGSLRCMFGIGLKHLREQGFRSLAYLDFDAARHRSRRELFLELAQPAKPDGSTLLEVVSPLRLADPAATLDRVPRRLQEWLFRLPKPVGIFCTTDGGGGYLIRVCRALGLRVPQDIAVIGTDETAEAMSSRPPLTTVVKNSFEVGHTAMRILCQQLAGESTSPGPIRVEATDLHVRESTAARAAEVCDIAAAQEYIREHACRGVSAREVFRRTQRVSEKTFYTHFKSATGQTPLEAIKQCRMQEARRLLTATAIPITEIANCCGFSDGSSFARRFRQAQGVSPHQYRESAKRAA